MKRECYLLLVLKLCGDIYCQFAAGWYYKILAVIGLWHSSICQESLLHLFFIFSRCEMKTFVYGSCCDLQPCSWPQMLLWSMRVNELEEKDVCTVPVRSLPWGSNAPFCTTCRKKQPVTLQMLILRRCQEVPSPATASNGPYSMCRRLKSGRQPAGLSCCFSAVHTQFKQS